MPDLHSLLLFLAAGLALNVTPGPDMLYVAARSTSEGRRAGIVSALGIGAGTLVHVVALAASRAGHVLRRGREARVLQRVTGGVFILLGARLALETRRVR